MKDWKFIELEKPTKGRLIIAIGTSNHDSETNVCEVGKVFVGLTGLHELKNKGEGLRDIRRWNYIQKPNK